MSDKETGRAPASKNPPPEAHTDATVRDAPKVYVGSRKGLQNSVLGTRNLMIIAALSIVGTIIVIPLQYLTYAIAGFGTLRLLCALMGGWLLAYLLPSAIVKKPGAALVASVIMGIIMMFALPVGPAAIFGSVFGAIPIEAGLIVFLYRRWDWLSYGIGATVFGALFGGMFSLTLHLAVTPLDTVINVGIAVVSCYVGVGLTLLLVRVLERLGIGAAAGA